MPALDTDRHLVLFDIDGTLLRSEGVGVGAMLRAFARIHGDRGFSFDGIEIAGALDGLLFQRVMAHHGLPADEGAHERFRRVYHEELAASFTPERVRRMPGMVELARGLSERGVATGLLTGNYRETALIKVAVAGYDLAHFPFGAFGADGPSRRHLTPIAIERATVHHGRLFEPGFVTVIGDTPLDVDCAKAHGCRSLAVGTGPYSADALRTAGADLAVADLSDHGAALGWILGEDAADRATAARLGQNARR